MKKNRASWEPLICNGSRYATESIRHFLSDIQKPELGLFGHEWFADRPEVLVVLEHKAKGLVSDRRKGVAYLKAPEMCMQPMELLANGHFPLSGHTILASSIGRWVGFGACYESRVEHAINDGKIRRIHLGEEPLNRKVEKAARRYACALEEYEKRSFARADLSDGAYKLRKWARGVDSMDETTRGEVLNLAERAEAIYRNLVEQHVHKLNQHKKELLDVIQHTHTGG